VGKEISYGFLRFRGNEGPIGVRIVSVSGTRHRNQEISEDSEQEEEEKEEK